MNSLLLRPTRVLIFWRMAHSRMLSCLFQAVVALWILDFAAIAAELRPHVLIKFKANATSHLRPSSVSNHLAQLTQFLNLPAGARLEEPALNQVLRAQARQKSGPQFAIYESAMVDRFFYLRLPDGLSVDEGIRRLSAHPAVDYVEADGSATGGVIPNDPYFPSQWHHRNSGKPSASIQTPLAWDLTQGSTNVLIAVLDTGLYVSADFAGRVVPGYNFAYNNNNTTDDYGHGTAVAGTLAASANNSTLVAGVDWRCRIMPVKVLDSSNFGYYSWLAQGVDFAVSNGARIINFSVGGFSTDITLARSITNAIAKGVIFVTITHNDGTNSIRFPGNMTNCITLGATDQQDRRTGFSNYGPEIDLCAPGIDIYTVGSSGGVEYWYGTSFSAPLAAGVCGLLVSVIPNLSHADARLLLCAGADDQVGDAADTPGFDYYHGWGRLNAYNSLLLAKTRVDQVQRSNNIVRLSWSSPPNASNKQPYQILFKNALTSAWEIAPATNAFAYTSNRTQWAETNLTSLTRFYRVRLRPLP